MFMAIKKIFFACDKSLTAMLSLCSYRGILNAFASLQGIFGIFKINFLKLNNSEAMAREVRKITF